MNSPIETGLFLPIRFYESLGEQDRYKRISKGVALPDEVFVYVDCDTLAPFQVVIKDNEELESVDWSIICLDTEEETVLPYTAADWEYWAYVPEQRLSYLGTTSLSGYVTNGRSYLELTVTTSYLAETYINKYYSDIFVIKNCSDFYETDDYRITSTSNIEKRAIDVTDLRITKQ